MGYGASIRRTQHWQQLLEHKRGRSTCFITEKCGHGLVAEDEIKKGEFVIEYVGEVIDDRTCENRLWTMKRLNDTDFYLCDVSNNMVIDATNKGNLSQFINHSCEPNTKMQKWTVDGETRVGIFALRDIKIGEELTYDYKKMLGTTKYSGSSQNHHAKKKRRKTNCENCIQQFLRLWHPQQNMYVGCWIVDFDQETKMHTLQFIDLHTEKFDLKEEEWHFLELHIQPGVEVELHCSGIHICLELLLFIGHKVGLLWYLGQLSISMKIDH